MCISILRLLEEATGSTKGSWESVSTCTDTNNKVAIIVNMLIYFIT